MFEAIAHLQLLHIDFGATQIGITNGNTPDGRDHAGATSTSYRSSNIDIMGQSTGGDCAGGNCHIREDHFSDGYKDVSRDTQISYNPSCDIHINPHCSANTTKTLAVGDKPTDDFSYKAVYEPVQTAEPVYNSDGALVDHTYHTTGSRFLGWERMGENFQHFQHNGGSAINGYFHDFGHNHIDNVQGSDINQNDMGHQLDDHTGVGSGHDADGNARQACDSQFCTGHAVSGNTSFGDSDDINQGDWFMHSNYLKTDGFDGPNGTGDDFVAGGRGMFGDYAVHALWTDTTTMGTDKFIPNVCHGNLDHYTFTCTHVPTDYGNNDTDNQLYWTDAPGHQNYQNGGAPNRKGDNGWQRSGNGYTHGDLGAGGGVCNMGDTCSVSNTFTKSGFGTVNSNMLGTGTQNNNGGVWANGAGSIGEGRSNVGDNFGIATVQ